MYILCTYLMPHGVNGASRVGLLRHARQYTARNSVEQTL